MIALLALLAAAQVGDLSAKIEGELEAWDLAGAARALDELVQAHPDSPEAAYFRGRILFEQGKYDDAVKEFAEAQQRGAGAGGFEGALENDAKLARAAAEETSGDQVFESEHFVLRTRPGKDTLLAPYALDALEKAFAGLTKDLGVQPAAKIRVEVYDSAKSLAHVSPLTVEQIKASGTIALCKYSRLMITSPKALLRGYPWLDTLSHEFVHYLVTQKGRNTVPIWLQEGLAKFLETRWRGQPGMAVDEMSLTLLQDASRKKALIPFARMHPSIAMLPTQEQAALAFAEVEAAMRLLYQRGGQQALTELVAAMASGMTDEQAVAQAYGKSFKEFEADWRAEAAHPRAKAALAEERAAGVGEEAGLQGGREGQDRPPERDRIAARAGDGSADAQAVAPRLGDILYARRRWGAAAKEYDRALATLPGTRGRQLARRYAFSADAARPLAPRPRRRCRAAVEADPEDEAAQALYAQALLHEKKFDQAKIALDNGIAVDPFDPGPARRSTSRVAKETKDAALEKREKNRVRARIRKRNSMSEVLAAVRGDAELIEELAQARQRISREIAKRVVGQEGGDRAAAHRALLARPLPVRRRAGAGEDAAHLDARRSADR